MCAFTRQSQRSWCHSEIKNIPVASQPPTKCTGKGAFVVSGQCIGTMESEKVRVV